MSARATPPAHLLNELLSVLAADEDLVRVTEWELGRERVVNDGVTINCEPLLRRSGAIGIE